MKKEGERLVAISYHGLTKYAVYCFREYINSTKDKVVIIATRPKVPICGLEEALGTTVVWVTDEDTRSIFDVAGGWPMVFVSGGWNIPSFSRWAREVKKHGGYNVAAPDESWLGVSLKEILRKLRWNLCFNKVYDFIFCGGAGGRKLFKFYGVDDSRIFESYFCANPELFRGDVPLIRREKRIIFVGNLNENKNVVRMAEAFEIASKEHSGWVLEVHGTGPLEARLREMAALYKNIDVCGFTQAEELGKYYRNAQIFVLGSHRENYGVVVHEAALSGCLLCLSDAVGAGWDFAKNGNSVRFNAASTEDFARAMAQLMGMTDEEKARGEQISLAVAAKFSPKIFAKNMSTIVDFAYNIDTKEMR